MTTSRLVYLTNARLPTEKAHGYQIVRMCEAFARQGVDVQLRHPYFRQGRNLVGVDVFDYYGIPQVFQVRTLRNLDILWFERYLPDGAFMRLGAAHQYIWGLYASLSTRKEGADVHYTREPVLAYWLTKAGLATVYEAHVVPARAGRWFLRRLAERSALISVVALTTYVREGLSKLGIPREKILVLPDGVDLDMFGSLPSRVECRRRLGLPLDRPIVGYIGRFETMATEKGIPELIRAMAHVAREGAHDALLLCVGGPMDLVPSYLELAAAAGVREGQMRFLDRVPNREVPLWIRACDVVAIPWPWTKFSAFFTSPLKLFEYMAAGVPIVATDLPALREVLSHRENAWLVAPGDPNALAAGIASLLRDQTLASSLSARAQRDVRKYSWEKRVVTILSAAGVREALYT